MSGVNSHLEREIGQRIRERREQLGLSQAKLGHLIGERLGREWTRQAMSAAEQGKRAFAVAELTAIAGALGMSVLQLLGEPAAPSAALRDAAARFNARADETLRVAQALIEDVQRLRLAALGL